MGQLRGLSTSHYVNNPLEAIRALTARVAALERALGRSQALQMDATALIPEQELPTAADIGTLLLVDEDTGLVYQLVARRADDGRETLLLRQAGRVRTLPTEVIQ
jgi:hypothetical protein